MVNSTIKAETKTEEKRIVDKVKNQKHNTKLKNWMSNRDVLTWLHQVLSLEHSHNPKTEKKKT